MSKPGAVEALPTRRHKNDSPRLLADPWESVDSGDRMAFRLVRGRMVGLGGMEEESVHAGPLGHQPRQRLRHAW
jgi:hypothetical protein